jgi:hypothetical protein
MRATGNDTGRAPVPHTIQSGKQNIHRERERERVRVINGARV